jgi:hypothetical protein
MILADGRVLVQLRNIPFTTLSDADYELLLILRLLDDLGELRSIIWDIANTIRHQHDTLDVVCEECTSKVTLFEPGLKANHCN